MSRSKDKNARLIEQLARGRRSRYTVSRNLILGHQRGDNTAPNRIMADIVSTETQRVTLFEAPCECKIVRMSINGSPYSRLTADEEIDFLPFKEVPGDTPVALYSASPKINFMNFTTVQGYRHNTTNFALYTDPAKDVTPNDVLVVPAANNLATDAFYFGSDSEFSCVWLNITTVAVDPVITQVWEYYNGAAWVEIPDITDESEGFMVDDTGWKQISWKAGVDLPSWATVAVDAITRYWVRCRTDAFTSITTRPIAGQAYIAPSSIFRNGRAVDVPLLSTAGVLDLEDGQHVYATFVMAGNVEEVVSYLTIMTEYVPMDAGYPRD